MTGTMKRLLAAALLVCAVCGVFPAALGEGGSSPAKVAWDWEAEPFPEGSELLTVWVACMVGADCMLVTYQGHTMLVDVGDRTTSAQVSEMLEAAGVEGVEYLFNTHPHADHIGGVFKLLDRGFSVGALITFFSHSYYENRQVVIQSEAIQAAEEAGVPILDMVTEETIPFGGATLTAYRVPDDRIERSMNCNNQSAMLMVELGDCRILLTGDVEVRSQQILAELYDLSADIMKFPHHGLNTANPTFLRAVSPAFVFFTNGSSRTKAAQAQLKKAGAGMTFATWGIIRMQTDGTRWILHQDFIPSIQRHAQKYFGF